MSVRKIARHLPAPSPRYPGETVCGLRNAAADEPRINRVCLLCRWGVQRREARAKADAATLIKRHAQNALATTIRCPTCHEAPGQTCARAADGTAAWCCPLRLEAARKRARYEGRPVTA